MAVTIKQEIAQQIAEAVKDVCSHDINFIDIKGAIFASTNRSRIGDFHEIGRQVAQTGETVEVSSDNTYTGTKKGVNLPFIYKGEISAVIGISGDPEEVRKYAYLAQKITAVILREHELDVSEHTRKTELNHVIRSIVFNEYRNPEYLNHFFKFRNIHSDTEYRTVLVKLNNRYHPANLSMIEKYIYQAFESTGSFLYTFNYGNEYILLLEAKKLTQSLHLLQKLGEKNFPLLKIGVGHAEVLTRQHRSYQSAKIAANSLSGDHSLAIFDDLDLEILLGNISEEVRQHFTCQTISLLSEKEKQLLHIYFSTNMSLKETSSKMYIHKNTLQYQLDKISHTTGYNPRVFFDAVVLYLALRVESGLEKNA